MTKKSNTMNVESPTPLLMTEEYWANTSLSVVRRFGRLKMNGWTYVIVNKEGKDIFQCSIEAERAGREKAIEPGEPCDLVWDGLVPYYRKLGREKMLEMLNDGKEYVDIVATCSEIKKGGRR